MIAVVLALGLVITLSSCSRYQVRDWFAARGTTIDCCRDGSAAHRIATAINLRIYLAAVAIPHEARWDRVAACESGGRWNISTGNGYYGGLQFSLSTWRAYGGTGYPHQQSKATQIRIAERVRTQSGLGHWPHCGTRW